MRVLMISGDTNLTRQRSSAHARFLLQKNAVEALELIVWPQQFFAPFFVTGQFDVVTSQDPFWRGLVAWIAAKRLKTRFNVQVHADLEAQSPIKHVLSQIVLRHAQSVRVVSERIKGQIIRYTKAPIAVLPIFVDLKKFENLEHMQHPKFPHAVLWIGRFEDEKNPLLALDILTQVRRQGVEVGLIMLGQGSLSSALLAKAKAEGLEKYVEFPGWQDPLTFLSYADVVLCTSRAESFGASMVEALAAGVPVVSLDVGIAKEAGAVIAKKEDLAQKLLETLQSGGRGSLQIPIRGEKEWAEAWEQSLQ